MAWHQSQYHQVPSKRQAITWALSTFEKEQIYTIYI